MERFHPASCKCVERGNCMRIGTASALYYLRHLRSCAAMASGSRCTEASLCRLASEETTFLAEVFASMAALFNSFLRPLGLGVLSLYFSFLMWPFLQVLLTLLAKHRWTIDLTILLFSAEPLPLLAAWHLLEQPGAGLILLGRLRDVHFQRDWCQALSAVCAWDLVNTWDSLALAAAVCAFHRPSFPRSEDECSDDE